MKFLLVCATTGERIDELKRMINSISLQTYNSWELYVVHQGNKNENEIKRLCDCKKNIYSNINQFGLSKARNVALKEIYSKYPLNGNFILGFPDDDCYYFPETLSRLEKLFINKDMIVCNYGEGEIIDDNITFKKKPQYIIFNTPSIGIFHRIRNVVYFDERLGLGTKFPCAEDSDYANKISKSFKVYFTDAKLLHHKICNNKETFNIEKHVNAMYGVGGYLSKLVRNDKEYKYIFFIFKLLTRQLFAFVFNSYKGRRYHIRAFYKVIIGYFDFK